MTLRESIGQFLPRVLETPLTRRRQAKDLTAIRTLPVDARNLRRARDVDVAGMLESRESGVAWKAALERIPLLGLPDRVSNGVSPDDRKAVFHVVRGLQPRSVLEIGTHVGASTLSIAVALTEAGEGGRTAMTLTTVDIVDVNDEAAKPWLRYGVAESPRANAATLGFGTMIEFVVSPSLEYLRRCSRSFDFIFLDGDHASHVVYQEVPAALQRLNPGGVILLHDYNASLKPLRAKDRVMPGPALAVERLLREGAPLAVVPLGPLPWAGAYQPNVTSLALLLRSS